jgi:hypothetical protein
LVPVQLLAELFSGRSCDRAGYCHQRQCSVELAEGGAESRVGRVLLVAWLGRAVDWPVRAGPCSQTLLLPPDVPQIDYSFLMCSQTMLLFLVLSRECWL